MIQILSSDIRWPGPYHIEEGPECLCSRCQQPIEEPEIAIRAWPDDDPNRYSYRFHPACLGIKSTYPLDDAYDEYDEYDVFDRDDSNLDLGPCCICEDTGPQVRTGLALPHPGALAGRGWGCLTCGLPLEGAMAVVCDTCFEAYKAGQAALRFFCAGGPEGGRRPIAELSSEPFVHDMSKHEGETP
jgi:hypothetical protein